MDCIVHWVTKSQTQLSNFHFCFAIDKHNLAPIYQYILFFFFPKVSFLELQQEGFEGPGS